MKLIENIQEINAAADRVITPDVAAADVAKVLAYWGFVRRVLIDVEFVTGSKADEKINEFIAVVDAQQQ